ncbi:hypothetical protein EVAR_77828_1 [Eumeta japonica]|uniref:Uncharacterized protein n=1 Tax=Eumeta variegata TaxID=151549 RepID=A0A4C1TC28_EUMVA|nr:hypothetical protein EVAR_77828_1 [Eumeta japonica]
MLYRIYYGEILKNYPALFLQLVSVIFPFAENTVITISMAGVLQLYNSCPTFCHKENLRNDLPKAVFPVNCNKRIFKNMFSLKGHQRTSISCGATGIHG